MTITQIGMFGSGLVRRFVEVGRVWDRMEKFGHIWKVWWFKVMVEEFRLGWMRLVDVKCSDVNWMQDKPIGHLYFSSVTYCTFKKRKKVSFLKFSQKCELFSERILLDQFLWWLPLYCRIISELLNHLGKYIQEIMWHWELLF